MTQRTQRTQRTSTDFPSLSFFPSLPVLACPCSSVFFPKKDGAPARRAASPVKPAPLSFDSVVKEPCEAAKTAPRTSFPVLRVAFPVLREARRGLRGPFPPLRGPFPRLRGLSPTGNEARRIAPASFPVHRLPRRPLLAAFPARSAARGRGNAASTSLRAMHMT